MLRYTTILSVLILLIITANAYSQDQLDIENLSINIPSSDEVIFFAKSKNRSTSTEYKTFRLNYDSLSTKISNVKLNIVFTDTVKSEVHLLGNFIFYYPRDSSDTEVFIQSEEKFNIRLPLNKNRVTIELKKFMHLKDLHNFIFEYKLVKIK